MISSIITRQQGLVSSGQVTSTLESGLISLAIQAWLSLYASSSSSTSTNVSPETAANFSSYVDSILSAISTTNKFTNVTAAALLPLDRLTIAQALAGLERQVDGEAKQRQLTTAETATLNTLNTSLAIQERNQYGGFWYVLELSQRLTHVPIQTLIHPHALIHPLTHLPLHLTLTNVRFRYYVYPSWSYLDGTVSFLPFMSLPQQDWSPSDALVQIQLLYANCFQPATGLLAHGYDASKTAVWANNATGASPYVWGRSLGWYLAGLVNAWDVLTTADNTNASSSSSSSAAADAAQGCRGEADCAMLLETIQSQFNVLVNNLVPYQDAATGAFWQLTTLPGREGNYLESSSTALFAFAILKGLRLNLLPNSDSAMVPTTNTGSSSTTAAAASTSSNGTALREAALRAYDSLLDMFVVDYGNGTLGYNGTVIVCSLNSTANYTYYTHQPINPNAALGEGAFVLASLEVERLSL